MTDSSVEVVLHKLIDAARMYEASCRLGGKDQEFASLKLDEAKSAALAAIPSPEREPMREALDEARFLCERLCDFESELDSDEVASEFYGHVAPSLARLQAMLAPPPAQSGDRT